MDIQKKWEKTLAETEVIRPRVPELLTFSSTDLPYILLSESVINTGDTVVRKGAVTVEKPSLILPAGLPQFKGFEVKKDLHIDANMLANFLVVRGVRFPSLRYNNKTYSVDIFEGGMSKAADYYHDRLKRKENTTTALVTGPQDCWQLSLIVYVCTQVIKSADGDVRRIMDEFRKKGEGS